MMKTPALLLAALSICARAIAADPPPPEVPIITVKGVQAMTFPRWIMADGVYRNNWPCLKATLHATTTVTNKEITGCAYFFDKDKKLISQFDRIPNAYHTDGYYGLPPVLKAHGTAEVLVPIETITKEKKWRTAVLVFGDARKLAAEVYPHAEATVTWKDFNFPQHDAMLAQEQEAAAKKK